MLEMNKIIQFLLFVVCLNCSQGVYGQEAHCGTSQLHQQLLQQDPNYAAQFNKTKAYLHRTKLDHSKTVINGLNTEYHIPCVVHVIHTGAAVGTNYNPTDAAIQAFLDHVNNGFSNANDVGSVPGTFNSVNTPFRFYLAKRNDISTCVSTTGINRIDNSSNATYVSAGVGTGGITDASLKSLVHWNENDYYNIYIVNKINGEDGYTTVGGFTAGYAYYPLLGGYSLDGMVVLAHQVSATNSTFIHELGHAFNLIHPFEGGTTSTCPTNGDCTQENDEVCDTDPIREIYTCNPSGNNPCTSIPYASTGIQFNYMSYYGCTDRFTAGQLSRMTDVINDIRTGYKNSGAVDPVVALPTAITAPTINPANATNSAGMGPTSVKFNTIDYTSNGFTTEYTGYTHYMDRTCNQATTVLVGNTYPITVKTDLNPQKVAVYIDYNNSGTFTNASPERVFTSTGTAGDFTHTGNITIPSNATLNTPLRMRVIADFASSTLTPTMQLAYGQAEDYSVTIIGAALPIVWKSFTVNAVDNRYADIRWATSMELHSQRFELQHSTDGIHFNTIYETPSHAEEGSGAAYSFSDYNAANGLNYYRVVQVDVDGKETTSPIESITLTENGLMVSLYPNPASQEIQMAFALSAQSAVTASVHDLNGREIKHWKGMVRKGYQVVPLTIAELPSGVYYLKINSSQAQSVKRFVKM
jgi:hypothetical protein